MHFPYLKGRHDPWEQNRKHESREDARDQHSCAKHARR